MHDEFVPSLGSICCISLCVPRSHSQVLQDSIKTQLCRLDPPRSGEEGPEECEGRQDLSDSERFEEVLSQLA